MLSKRLRTQAAYLVTSAFTAKLESFAVLFSNTQSIFLNTKLKICTLSMQCKLGIHICNDKLRKLRGYKVGLPEFQLVLRNLNMRTD